MNPLKKLAGQTVVYGMGTIVPRLLNYFLTPFYTRLYHPGAYGIVVEFYTYIAFISIILTFGLETGFFRFASKASENRDSVFSASFSSVFSISSVFLVLSLLFATSISNSLGYHTNTYVINVALILFFDALAAVPFAKLRIQNKAMIFSLLKLFNVGLIIILNIWFLMIVPWFQHRHVNLDDLKFIFISNTIASASTFFILFFITSGYTTKFKFSFLKQLLLYSFPICISGFAGTINEAIDRVLLKHYVSDPVLSMKMLGIYGANAKIAVLMTLFIQMFRFAAEPFFFKNHEEKNDKSLYGQVSKYFTIFSMFIFIGVVANIHIFKYFVGHSYWDGLGLVPILLLSNYLLGMFYNLSFWYKLTNHTLYGLYLTFIGAFVTVLINIVFIPIISYYACAIARVLCYIIICITSYLWGQKHFPLNYQLKRIGEYVIVTLVIVFLLYSIYFYLPAYVMLVVGNFLLITFFFYVLMREKLKIKSLLIWK